jgi:hypothetical protein
MILLKNLEKFIAKTNPEWKAIQRIADSYQSEMYHSYVKGFRALRSSIDVEALVATQDIRLYPQHINWGIFDRNTSDIYSITGKIVYDSMNIIVKKANIKGVDFKDQRISRWIVDNVGKSIKQVDRNTINGIQEVIMNAMQKSLSAKKTAMQIRQYIGLTDNQIKSVLRYQERLDESGRSIRDIDRMVDAYINRKIRERALTIAQTETIRAATGGQQLNWEMMLDRGQLNKDEFVKTWITTPDDRTCISCAMLNGITTEIDGVFGFGGKTPPLHPRCRCAIGLVKRLKE